MKPQTQKPPLSLTTDQRRLVLQSIAVFIQQIGFSKTLKYLLKEAHIQEDSLESCSINLEEICCQYLTTRNNVKPVLDGQGANQNGVTSVDTSEKQKEKGGNEGKKADVAKENKDVDGAKIKSNTKKKSKSVDVSSQQVIVESESKFSNNEEVSLSVPSEPAKKSKVKKNKDDEVVLEKQSEVAAAAPEQADNRVKKEKKEKGKKEKKGKKERVDEAVLEKQSEVTSEAPEQADNLEKKEENKEKKEKKGKKEKKEKNKINHKEEHPISSSIGTTEADKEKKDLKKRKKSSSEEDGAEEAVVNAAKRRKMDNSDLSNGVVQPLPNGSANGVLEEDGGNQSHKQDKTTERNGSAEPKTVNAFRRVKPEEVEFLDEKLQDNSYWAKDGADSGYGAKAQEVLGQVRGRDFRHEKTKKKRGSYRGGLIDLQTHSVKFNYGDDDE